MTLPDLLGTTLDMRGSDLHLSVGTPPQVRVDGALRRLDLPDLTPDVVKALCYSIMSDTQKKMFEDAWELDLAFGLPGVGRVRGNVFNQKGAVSGVYRLVPERIRSLEDLGLPSVLAMLADRPRGLVLVTGPTGSGKSTTLAAMIDRINQTKRGHTLTIEDPIEYLRQHRACLVSQRELHADTRGLRQALRAALREDPDVVLVGEMRDLETTESALTLAETGHLTMATLHTNSAAQTITRVVDAFPAHQQSQIRTHLSLVLEGIACQALVARTDGQGRVVALEVLVATPAVRNLIREDKIHQVYGTMQTGQERHGMQTMNQSLARLAERRTISRSMALSTSSRPDELTLMLERGTPAAVLAAGQPLRGGPR